MSEEFEVDRFPTVTMVSDAKERLQMQQKAMAKAAPRANLDVLNIRAELDTLWTCVEVLAQVADGIAPERVIVNDHFTNLPPKRRRWFSWKR